MTLFFMGCFHVELEHNSITFNYGEAVKRVLNIIVSLAFNLDKYFHKWEIGALFHGSATPCNNCGLYLKPDALTVWIPPYRGISLPSPYPAMKSKQNSSIGSAPQTPHSCLQAEGNIFSDSLFDMGHGTCR